MALAVVCMTSHLRCITSARVINPISAVGLWKVHNFRSQYYSSNHENQHHQQSEKSGRLLLPTVGVLGAAVASWVFCHYGGMKQQNGLKALEVYGEKRPDLPSYTMEDVAKHSSRESGKVWVTFRFGVYDITSFIDKHPGGDKILMAAGGSVEPFWMMYGVHKQPAILAMLEEYRIGNITEEEAKMATANMEDPYSSEPRRHPALQPRSAKPFNAEPPLSLLVDSYITPDDLFYVRNHLPVPTVDPETYELEITGVGVKDVTLKLKDLDKYETHTITAAVQCAGNRRSEMTKIKPVKGLNWNQGAIGNAVWSGPTLHDVLIDAGFKEGHEGANHVQFEGLDTDPANVPYGASIPIEKALDPHGDVILATRMNGKPLTRDHGFPVRVIVPGIAGARNVKWLGRIIVSEEESESHWQQGDYKGFNPSVDWDSVDFSSSPAIQELPVTSAICEPLENESVTLIDGKLNVRGYAWSGGGREIIRVDVTIDQGKTWYVATFTDKDANKSPRHWAWALWKAEIPIQNMKEKEVEIWVKAVDASYNTQPESFENIWNLRGVLNNGYHRIKVNIKGNKKSKK